MSTPSFSRTQFPSGGWIYYQSQTGWSAPSPISNTFDQQVTNIIKHRLANPAAVAKHNLSTNVVAVGNELENFTRLRLGMPSMEAMSPKQNPPLRLPQVVAGAVAAVAKLADGVGLLLDWLPEGKTVATELSVRRAGVCAQCPKNSDKAFASFFTEAVSKRLQKMVEARKDLKLETPFDDKLGTCEICLCPMKLKCHVPLDFILAHTKPTTMAEFPEWCWVKKQDA